MQATPATARAKYGKIKKKNTASCLYVKFHYGGSRKVQESVMALLWLSYTNMSPAPLKPALLSCVLLSPIVLCSSVDY